ncbi:MAG: hypothetical protein U0325_23505 [Polyangiales bacterium]
MNAIRPTAVTGLEAGVTGLSVGEDNGCALLRTGFVACWGPTARACSPHSGALRRSAVARTLFTP